MIRERSWSLQGLEIDRCHKKTTNDFVENVRKLSLFGSVLSATYPQNFFLLKKSTSLPDFISEKLSRLIKSLRFQWRPNTFCSRPRKVGSAWVGLRVTSLREQLKHSIEFWLSLEGCQTFLGYLWFIFYRNRTRFLRKRTVSSSITIWTLATIWTTAMYIYFLHFEGAGRQRRLPRCNFCKDQDRQFAGPFGL